MDADFSLLMPDRVLDAVERATRQRCTGVIRPLPSYINRVYTVELEDGQHLVAKFYRPGRWTREALTDEHAFLQACSADEIPVVAPLPLAQGGTLGDADGIAFALFTQRGGRPVEPADANRVFIASRHDLIAAHGPYDAIFAMAVFTRRPEEVRERDLRDISSHYPFALFARDLRQLLRFFHPDPAALFDDPHRGRLRPDTRQIAANEDYRLAISDRRKFVQG